MNDAQFHEDVKTLVDALKAAGLDAKAREPIDPDDPNFAAYIEQRFTYTVTEEQHLNPRFVRYIGTCEQFPKLKYVGWEREETLTGIQGLVRKAVLADG